jgi:hypothetical protein
MTQTLTPKHLEVRRQLKNNFRLYAKYALKIRTKSQEIVPLVFNDAQEILNAAIEADLKRRGYVRIIILKGRQQGLSTAVGGYLYFQVSQRRAAKAMVVTHHADSTRTLFDMTKRYHQYCPEILRPSTKYSSRKELSFNELDSSYVVATAGGEAIGRSETISHLHASEIAFWPASTARENWNGLIKTVPNTAGTAVFIESTANGMSGIFYELWQGAVEGKNDYTPVFIPWFLEKGYRLPVDKPLEHTPEELELIAKYGLDDEQLMFRRKEIALTSLELFKQEYPCYPEEAFLTTGRPVFNPDAVEALLKNAPEPIAKMALEGEEWQHNPRGELLVYREHAPAESYYIGADVAIGVRGGNYSVAQVLDSHRRQVAVWRGIVDPDYFATILNALGHYYNTAFICPENNNHGILTCARLGKDLNYPNLYMVTEVDKVTDKESTRLGFSTTVKTKPLIIDQLREKLRDGEIKIYDKTTLREMKSFVVTESGAMEAEPGCLDDCVMSLALANHVNEGAFTPVEATDDWYIEMV